MKIFLLFLLIFSQLLSAPAFTKLREFKNADGETFMAKAQGNQHLNWIQTQDGEILKYNLQTKNYEYAKIKNKRLKASGIKYKQNKFTRAGSFREISKVDSQDLSQLWQERQKEHYLKTKALAK